MDKEKIKEKLKQRTLDTQMSLRINGEQLKWLQTYAKELGVSVNKLIVTVLEQFQEESRK